jgi:hypothetical protein
MDELEFWKERARKMEKFADGFALQCMMLLVLLWVVILTR